MQNFNDHVSEEEFACLPDLTWALLLVALVPHLLAFVGLNTLTVIAACACFPASMGPFAPAHAYILTSRLGFISNMSWISAITFSLIWSTILWYSWRKNRAVAVALGAFSFIVSAGWIWLLIAPV